jgi:hypothetical protein
MRKYTYAANGYNKTASIIIEEGKWWYFALNTIVESICACIPHILFPKIKLELKDQDSIDFNNGNKYTTYQEWYGSSDNWFCLKVHNNVLNYCSKNIDTLMIKVEYNELKKFLEKYDKSYWERLSKDELDFLNQKED